MRSTMKLGMLAVAAAAVLFVDGCNNDSTPVITQKAETYYQVFAIETEGGSDRMIIGSKEGVSVGRFTDGNVTVERTYGAETFADDHVRALVSDTNGKYVVAGTNGGINVCLLDGNGAITSVASYTVESTPSLESNNTNEMVLVDDMLIASSYQWGIAMGEIDPQTGTIGSLIKLDTNSTPPLPQNTVTALAVSGSKEYVLIGTQRKGVAVAHYDAQTKRIDAITSSLDFNGTAYRFVHDIVVDPVLGMTLIASNGGITVAKLEDNGTLNVLHSFKNPELPFRQFNTVALSRDGKKMAAGTFASGLILADLQTDGRLANIRTVTTQTPVSLSNDHVFSLAFSKDDSYLLVGSQSGQGDIITAIGLY